MDNNFENQPIGNMNPQPELNNQPMGNMNPQPELNNQPMNNGYQQPMYNQPMGNMNPQPELNNQPMGNMNPQPEFNNQPIGYMNPQPELNNQPMGNMNPQPELNNQTMNNGYQQPMYNQPMNGGYDPNMYNMQPQPEKKSKIGLIIVLAVLFIGAVVAVLFLTGVLGGKDKDESSSGNSNEVSNSNSNSNEPSNSNTNEPSNSNSNYSSNSNSNSNSNGIVSQSDINGVYTCGNSSTLTITSYSLGLAGVSSGKATSLSGTLGLDNSIPISFDYQKSGYNYNFYHLKNVVMVQGTQTEKSDEEVIVIMGLSNDKKSLHIVLSSTGSTKSVENVCTRK